MKKVIFNNSDPYGKFTLNYEGPYIVEKVLFGGALILIDMAGTELAYPINAYAVKIFYLWNEEEHLGKDSGHSRTCAHHAYHAFHEHVYLFCGRKQKEAKPVDDLRIPNGVIK